MRLNPIDDYNLAKLEKYTVAINGITSVLLPSELPNNSIEAFHLTDSPNLDELGQYLKSKDTSF